MPEFELIVYIVARRDSGARRSAIYSDRLFRVLYTRKIHLHEWNPSGKLHTAFPTCMYTSLLSSSLYRTFLDKSRNFIETYYDKVYITLSHSLNSKWAIGWEKQEERERETCSLSLERGEKAGQLLIAFDRFPLLFLLQERAYNTQPFSRTYVYNQLHKFLVGGEEKGATLSKPTSLTFPSSLQALAFWTIYQLTFHGYKARRER